MEGLYIGGALTHGGAEVEFLYPAGVRWGCARCGRCCRDVEGHERRVLLLDGDIRRLEEAGASEFYEATGSEPFRGLMLKRGGVCVLHGPEGCTVYGQRALLCRMYPFWVELLDEAYVVHVDPECPGVGEGEELGEGFYRELLGYALAEMDNSLL
ncbi:MAG TPA: YkgJ family cysteine cluster protein [Candidatus Bathyarchaeia archaeon]